MMDDSFVIVSQVPEALFIFFFFYNLFSICCSDWMNCIVLCLSSLIFSFIIFTLLLNPSIEFFITVIVFFSSIIPLFFSYRIYFFAVIFWFLICFKRICNSLLKHCYSGCFKNISQIIPVSDSSQD